MDGEAEGDTVVIAGQPEVLSTQAMQVIYVALVITDLLFLFFVFCFAVHNIEVVLYLTVLCCGTAIYIFFPQIFYPKG